MDDLKVIAQISSRMDSQVDRVSTTRVQASLGATSGRKTLQLRRKTLLGDKALETRLTRLRIQDNYERLKKSRLFDCGEVLQVQMDTEELQVLTRWVDGHTLADESAQETLRPDDATRIRARLRLWARFFERLHSFHMVGVCHGNIKPGNLLVCENPASEMIALESSEFFQPNDETPRVVLLDGGYQHLLGMEQLELEEKEDWIKSLRQSLCWQPPEVNHGLEGSYGKSSDIFSMSALMAWDLGVLGTPTEEEGLAPLWPLLSNGDRLKFCLGGQWHQCQSRNPMTEAMRRLKNLLVRTLDPLWERRLAKSREVAFELFMMAKMLENSESVLSSHAYTPAPAPSLPQVREQIHQTYIESGAEFAQFVKADNPSHRLWVCARHHEASQHLLLRKMAAALILTGHQVLYFRVRHSEREFPFAALDRFTTTLLALALRHNPSFYHEFKSSMTGFNNQGQVVLEVLPSLRRYLKFQMGQSSRSGDFVLPARHESLLSALERILSRILVASRVQYVVFDDFQRSDASSLSVFLKLCGLTQLMGQTALDMRWVFGLRNEESFSSGEVPPAVVEALDSEPTFTVPVDHRQGSAWITRLNSLSPAQARMLTAWACVGLPLRTDVVEHLSLQGNRIAHYLEGTFHSGKAPKGSPHGHADENSIGWDDVKHAPEKTSSGKVLGEIELLTSAAVVLNHALENGILGEERCPVTGRVVSFPWESQRVSLSLYLLASQETKSSVNLHLANLFSGQFQSGHVLWSDVLRVAELYLGADMQMSSHVTFLALMRAAEEVSDVHSSKFLISRFLRFEERLEKKHSTDADSLIPRIREQVGDLARALGQLELASRYYTAVGWSIFQPRRRAILAFKSWFPTRLMHREERKKAFLHLIKEGEVSGLLPPLEDHGQIDPNRLLEAVLFQMEMRLQPDSPIDFAGVFHPETRSFQQFLSVRVSSSDSSQEKLPYTARSRPIREIVLSQFLRESLGWVDGEILLPQCFRLLQMSLDLNDGATLIHNMFTTLLAMGRQCRPELRYRSLRALGEMAALMGNDLAMVEAILMRAWMLYFFEGQLDESRRALETLFATNIELPDTIRKSCNRILLLLEFEGHAIEKIRLRNSGVDPVEERLDELGLNDWSVGWQVLGKGLRKAQKFEYDYVSHGLVSNILSEMMDQTLLNSWLGIENSQFHASSAVLTRCQELRQREWFADAWHPLEFFPASVARIWSEKMGQNGGVDAEEKKAQAHQEIRKLRILKDTSKGTLASPTLSLHPSRQQTSASDGPIGSSLRSGAGQRLVNWAQDSALAGNYRWDRVSTPDPEKLMQMSGVFAQAGFQWVAHRLAVKGGSTLARVLSDGVLGHEGAEGVKRAMLPRAEGLGAGVAYLGAGLPLEGAASLAFLMEFLSNFERNLEVRHKEKGRLASGDIPSLIQESVPFESDGVEKSMGSVLRAAARRMQTRQEVPSPPDEHLPKAS